MTTRADDPGPTARDQGVRGRSSDAQGSGPPNGTPAASMRLTNGRLLLGAVLALAAVVTLWKLAGPGGDPPRAPSVKPPGPATGVLMPAHPVVVSAPNTGAATAAQTASQSQHTAEVTVDAIGGAAEVLADGRVIGTTPYRSQLPVGTQVVLELRRAGAVSTPVQFQVRPIDNRYDIVLQRAP
jgi:hypothetical protein